MQSKNQIKPFRCGIHTSEQIQRVCLEPNVETSLRCIECILTSTDKVSKDAIVTLNDFIDQAARQYETFRRISSFEDSAPNQLVEFLSQEEQDIEKLTHHIEQEKQRVGDAFNAILQEFTLLCHSKKEDIFRQLDKQLVCLKLNYTYYKSKIDRYYSKSNENELNPDKDTLIEKMNQCQDTNEAEVLVKNIKDDILEATTYKDPQIKIAEIKDGLNNLAVELKRQSAIFPQSSFHDLAAIEDSLKKFKDVVNPLMEDFSEIDNQIYEFSLSQATSIDSKIIKKADDIRLLKKWLSPSGGFTKFKLLYRGTRDGMDANTFHKKCDDFAPTLTIVKSNLGKICGGFSDQKWTVTNNYKTSDKCFLFSIDEKEKFPLRKNNTQAVYGAANYGPTFGGGHDLYINLTAGGFGQQSYSNLGHSYEIKGKNQNQKQSLLAGAYQFGVEEIEVFYVDNKPGSGASSSKSDSLILDSKKDLPLIKNWIARGKNIDLELLYRGSRDGFYAKDFHKNCDDKGATLVVCKSAYHNKVFGGYASKSWSQVEDYIQDKQAFLFSVSNSTKHSITNGDCALFGSSEAGPVFGAGYDLFICSNSNLVEDSTSALGMTYQANDNLGNLTEYLAGDSSFMLQEIEVFKVNIH